MPPFPRQMPDYWIDRLTLRNGTVAYRPMCRYRDKDGHTCDTEDAARQIIAQWKDTDVVSVETIEVE